MPASAPGVGPDSGRDAAFGAADNAAAGAADGAIDSAVAGKLFGRYRVVRAVGVGGFARVYHAIDPDLELDVAVKVLRPELAHDPEVVERFRREATTAARLRHPHVITVLTVGRLTEPFDDLPAGAPYLVMDYLPHSLAERLGERDVLPADEVARIGAEVARGLAYAHRQAIVHRDVKPENVLFARDGRAVVTDFGIARALSASPSGPSRQVLLGTPAYFSPEQARGLPLDGRSDLYSLGVTLYRAATGVVPFDGDDWYVVMRQHIETVPRLACSLRRELPHKLEALLARSLAKDPAERFPTGDAMAEALDGVRGTVRGTAARSFTTEIPRVLAAAARRTPRPHRVLRPGTPAVAVTRWRRSGAVLAAVGMAIVGGRVLANRRMTEPLPRSIIGARGAVVDSLDRDSASRVDGSLGTARAILSRALGGGDRGRTPVGSSEQSREPLDAQSGGAEQAELAARDARTAGGDQDLRRNAEASLSRASARGRLGGIADEATGRIGVVVPNGVEVYLDGDLVSHGPWRRATVPVGRHIVRASLGVLPGCSSADTAVAIDVAPGSARVISLDPVPCGRLMLEFSAPAAPHYTLSPLQGGPAREGMLPLAQPLVLPDGKYKLVVEARACARYEDTIPVVAGTIRREPRRRMLCE